MTASVRIVNDGNCAEDHVIVRYGVDHALYVGLKRGEVSDRLSADQTIRLESIHAGPKAGDVRILVVKPEEGEEAARRAYSRYCAAVGGSTFDGRLLPDFTDLGDRQKGGWVAASGVPDSQNPYLEMEQPIHLRGDVP